MTGFDSVFAILKELPFFAETLIACNRAGFVEFFMTPIFSTNPGFCYGNPVFAFLLLYLLLFLWAFWGPMEEKKPYVLAKLSNRKGDLCKRWYIEFQTWNRDTLRLEKKQIYCPAKYKTSKKRSAWANDAAKQIDDWCIKDWWKLVTC